MTCPSLAQRVTLWPMLILAILAAIAVGILALFGGIFITPEWD